MGSARIGQMSHRPFPNLQPHLAFASRSRTDEAADPFRSRIRHEQRQEQREQQRAGDGRENRWMQADGRGKGGGEYSLRRR